jgi:hypothetical protein
MNIFYLDKDPKLAAQMHCDKHVVKMILETAQLLCTAHRELDGVSSINSYGDIGQPYHEIELYKSTHKNHPSAVWVRNSASHYSWTCQLFIWLCEEYLYRYKRQHATDAKFRWVLGNHPKNIPLDAFTPPPQCMPDEFKRPDVVDAYRAYYKGAKASICKWTNREVPSWWN